MANAIAFNGKHVCITLPVDFPTKYFKEVFQSHLNWFFCHSSAASFCRLWVCTVQDARCINCAIGGKTFNVCEFLSPPLWHSGKNNDRIVHRTYKAFACIHTLICGAYILFSEMEKGIVCVMAYWVCVCSVYWVQLQCHRCQCNANGKPTRRKSFYNSCCTDMRCEFTQDNEHWARRRSSSCTVL